jgi:hypothetical protein
MCSSADDVILSAGLAFVPIVFRKEMSTKSLLLLMASTFGISTFGTLYYRRSQLIKPFEDFTTILDLVIIRLLAFGQSEDRDAEISFLQDVIIEYQTSITKIEQQFFFTAEEIQILNDQVQQDTVQIEGFVKNAEDFMRRKDLL